MSTDPSFLVEPLSRLRRLFSDSPAARRTGYAAAAVIFLVGGAIAVAHLPEIGSVDWALLLLVAAIGVPATIGLGARRFQLSGRVIGIAFTPSEAFNITIASTASNVLPIPGGVVVRGLALKRSHTSYGQVGIVTLAMAMLWLAGVLVLAGACLALMGSTAVAWAALLAGVAAGAISWIRLQRLGAGIRHLAELIVVQALLVLLDTYRVYLVIAALGLAASYLQVGVLGLASFAGSAAGFAPGGLGVRELIASALGVLIDLDPATAFVGTAINRVVGLAVVGAIVGIMAIRNARWFHGR